MVRIQGFADLQNPSGTRFAYCIDRYEASKPDATADSQGENELYSVSRAGVLPWTGLSRAEAQAACEATAYNENVGVADQLDSNRLCPASVWSQTCGGLVGGQQRDYIYGDTFEEGSCVDGRDGTNTPQPSGSLSSCSRTLSASALYFDLTGNVWEWISDRPAAGQNRVAWMLGGSYAWPETTAGTEGVVKEGAMICIPDLQAIESQDLLRCSDQSQCATRPGTTCVDGRCRDSCTTDADCSAFLRCQTAQDDGSDYCFHFSETLPDADSGDWSDYNNVGFRCCRP
jgi:formylglycine-generating enzyme required for sulfatase activity